MDLTRNRRFFIGIAATITIMVVAACVPATTPPATTEPGHEVTTNSVGQELPPDAAPPHEQVLRIMGRERKHLDVTADQYNASMESGAAFLWERLVMLDENYQVVPGVADKWEPSADGKRWTFHLREDAQWSDGTPLRAQDFEYGLKRQLDPATGSTFGWFYYDVKGARGFNQGENTDPNSVGITAIDDHTLVVETEDVTPYLPMLMAFPSSSPAPKWIIEEYGSEWSINPDACLTNSTWRLLEYTKGRGMVIGLNPNYRGIHKAYLERIEVTFGTAENFFPAYQAEELDALHASGDVEMVSPADLLVIQRDPELSRELHTFPIFGTWYIFFKTSEPPFDNSIIWQAISHAIDRETLASTTLNDIAVPAYGMLPPGFPGFQGDALASLQIYDPDLAKQLMAQAGYPDGEGFPTVDMWLREPAPAEKATAEAIQNMLLENLGINVNIVSKEKQVYYSSLSENEIPMSLISWMADYIDPANFMNQVWHSETGRHDWSNEEFDHLTSEAAHEVDYNRRLQLYQQAERILVEDVGGVFVWHPLGFQMWKPYVRGIPRSKDGYEVILPYNLTMTTIYVAEH